MKNSYYFWNEQNQKCETWSEEVNGKIDFWLRVDGISESITKEKYDSLFSNITGSLNEIVSTFRTIEGYTQKEIAEKIGVRSATISDFENGKYNLGSDKLEKIMQVLNLTLSKLPNNGKSAEAKIKKT